MNLNGSKFKIYVVVQFYPWFKFYFPLFLCIVMNDNELKTNFEPRIKLNHNIYIVFFCNKTNLSYYVKTIENI